MKDVLLHRYLDKIPSEFIYKKLSKMFCDPISCGTKVSKVTSFRSGFTFFFRLPFFS